MLRLALFLILALAAAAPAPAQEPLTAASLRTIPPDALSRRLLGELAAIAFLLPPERQTRGTDDKGMTWIQFLTRPRSSHEPGVCEIEFLQVLLEPLGAPGPDTPLRPWAMATARGSFIVQDVRIARTGVWPNWPARDRARESAASARHDADCAGIDPRQVELVFADHGGQVGRAVALVADLLDSAQAGRTPAPATCRDRAGRRLSNDDCLRLLAALRVGSLNQVRMTDGCGGMDRPSALAPHNRCLRAWLWDPQRHDRIEIGFLIQWGRQELIRIEVRPRPVVVAH